MKRNIRMPFVPKIIEDESLISYINRLSKVNNYKLAWLHELIIKVTEDQSYKRYDNQKKTIDTTKLSIISGIDKQELDNLSLNLNPKSPVKL